jgi:hypothetical protein
MRQKESKRLEHAKNHRTLPLSQTTALNVGIQYCIYLSLVLFVFAVQKLLEQPSPRLPLCANVLPLSPAASDKSSANMAA